MSDENRGFHEIALNSVLFKGRSDWYYCFLKAEKIAHVLAVLAQDERLSAHTPLSSLAHDAAQLPPAIAHFVAGEVEAPAVLADLFSLTSAIRFVGTSGLLSNENALVLIVEYEKLAEKFSDSLHPSPFAVSDQFSIPALQESQSSPRIAERLAALEIAAEHLKDNKGQSEKRSHVHAQTDGGLEKRAQQILEYVLKNRGVSVKEISSVIRDCSEKTIQRELAMLVKQKLIKRVGERRWSLYLPASIM